MGNDLDVALAQGRIDALRAEVARYEPTNEIGAAGLCLIRDLVANMQADLDAWKAQQI